MPHVIIDSNIDFNLIHEEFQKKEYRYIQQEKMYMIKLTGSFQNELGNKLLIQTISIENNFSTEYFVELIKKGSQITVRLFPLTYPTNKTPNIFRSIALVTSMIRESDKATRFAVMRTNIQPYLPEVLNYENRLSVYQSINW